jgi:hypothetical protein
MGGLNGRSQWEVSMGVKDVVNISGVISMAAGTKAYLQLHRAAGAVESDYRVAFDTGWASQSTYQTKFDALKAAASVSQAAFDGVGDDADAFSVDDIRGLAWWTTLSGAQKSDRRGLFNGSAAFVGQLRIHQTNASTNTLSAVCTKAQWSTCVAKADTETQEGWEPFASTAFGAAFWGGITGAQRAAFYSMFKAL